MNAGDHSGNVFDEVADDYDTARPGYPEQLFDSLVAESGIPDDGRILEIGCGTGKGTLPFARRAFSILGLEPGPKLAAVARRNLAAYPKVRIEETTFEDWTVAPGAFDLVTSAQAFHWIDPATALPKISECLRPGGFLAVFWNVHPSEDFPLRKELDRAWERHVPEVASAKGALERKIEAVTRAITASRLFEDVVERRFPWSATYDTSRFLRLLGTFSDHRALPEEARENLYGAITSIIDGAGGTITLPYVAVLHLARRA